MGFVKNGIERSMYIGAKPELFRLALRMRKNPTQAEEAMWGILRKYRKRGIIFRQQHPIDFYIADFYCHKLKLVIEIDGAIHSNEEIHLGDEGRTGELERFEITVIRFTNNEVLSSSKLVEERIDTIIRAFIDSVQQSPSLPGEGDKGGEAERKTVKTFNSKI